MALIPFSKFGSKPQDLDDADAKTVDATLSEKLKVYLLNKVPEAQRAFLVEKLKAVSIKVTEQREKSLSSLVDDLLAAHFSNDNEVKSILSELSGRLRDDGVKVGTFANLDVPLKENPAFRNDYLNAKTKAFGELAGLSAQAIDKLSANESDIDDVDEQSLSKLLEDNLINAAQKKKLELVVNLSRLSGENFDFVKGLQASGSTIEDFINYDSKDWMEYLTREHVPLPAGEKSISSYAEFLQKNMETSFPQTFFLNRVILKKDFLAQLSTFKAVDNLRTLGKIKFEGSNILLDEIKWTGISESEKKLLLAEVQDLQKFAHQYRYLNITEVLAKEDIDIERKTRIVIDRLNQLKIFYQKNEKTDFAQYDFFDPAKPLDYTGITDAYKPLIRAQAMAFQRMLEIGENAKTTLQLLAKGFSSSADIIHAGELRFVSDAGLDLNEATMIYNAALGTATATSHFFQASRDAQRGGFNALTVNNIAPVVNDLREIDGYAELFGKQNYCECDHCRSIFSPAAYFTDLMLFIENNVTRNFFTGDLSTHPLNLKNRRPDLWKIPLTCQNTTTEIPYLDVVNDVLEQYIQLDTEGSAVYEHLAGSEISCSLPFNLPLEELRNYVGYFGLSLRYIYKTLNVADKKIKQESLLISDKELEIITTSDTTKALRRFDLRDPGAAAKLNNLSVSDFIRFANISRQQLDELIAVKSITEISSVKIIITESPEDIQLYSEYFQQNTLTKERLDFIHRFLKLWGKTPCSIPEFDMVMLALKKAGLFRGLEQNNASGDPEILIIADVITIKNTLNLNIEELCSLIFDWPETALKPIDKPLYERLFDLKGIFGFVAGTQNYNIEVALTNIRAEDKITPYLLAGLSISEHELNLLFKMLEINNIDTPVVLNKNILLRLYRQSRLASGLKLSIENFVAAVKTGIVEVEVTSVSEIIRLIAYTQWILTTPFSFLNIDFILNGTGSPDNKFAYTQEKVKTLVTEVQAASLLSGVTVLVEFKDKLQKIFNITAGQLIDYYAKLATINIDDELIIKALNSNFNDLSELNSLISFLNQLEQKIYCFDKLKWNENDISLLTIHPEIFGMADIKKWTLDDIKSMVIYSTLFNGVSEDNKTDIRKILEGFTLTAMTDTLQDLSIILWTYDVSLITAGIMASPLVGSLMQALSKLHEVLKICTTLGIQPDSLTKLIKADFDGLTEASNILYGSFASKYADEKTRLDKLAPYHDKINTRKRDALCDYIIAQTELYKFRDRSELYHFFLLEVEMSGCFRTSKLVAAISSVQLYIHRCLMNLEQSDADLNPVIPKVYVAPGSIPATEWEWRKNYRVWEANRKVFLYPENYIDPGLRVTKTPLFKELEDELLQQNITLGSAESAYKKYLAQFLELSYLRYAGAYHNVVDYQAVQEIDITENGFSIAKIFVGELLSSKEQYIDQEKTIYYFFARTHLQPYQYYYRTFNSYKKLWGHWEKVDVPIEAEEVSAIIQNGKLHIYWTEVQHKEISKIDGGSASSESIVFTIGIKYTNLDAYNKWTSPQRLNLGRVHSTNQEVLSRLGLAEIEGETAIKNDKDEIIETYKHKVFRKPYISKLTQLEMLVRHIYTPGSQVKTVEYVTKRKRLRLTGVGIPFVEVPPATFIVSNNEFENAPPSRFSINNDNSLRVKIQIQSATLAKIEVFFKRRGVIHSDELGVESHGDEQDIKLTKYSQNLYKTIHEPTREFTKNTDILELFRKEYLHAFNEDGNYVHYVENGDKDFIRENNILTQVKSGKADLSINVIDRSDVIPLSTILSDELNITLAEQGLEEFLSLRTQNMPNSVPEKFDFNGPYGAYYWEMFFHIPFLVANQLNANQDFKSAKWWYERIFNPTSAETPVANNSGEHYWQFREFRNVGIDKLKDILTDEATISVYKKDPFDPHAIARLRISAYQKAIVMKYIDNLLDWGDYLFTKDTQESIVEADMLYQLAQDVLGKRPEKIEKCPTASDDKLNFENIFTSFGNGSEFLISLENIYGRIKRLNLSDRAVVISSKYLSKVLEDLGETDATPSRLSDLARLYNAKYLSDITTGLSPVDDPVDIKPTVIKYSRLKDLTYLPANANHKQYSDIADPANKPIYEVGKPVPASDLIAQSKLAFCVPVNENLLQYWDRVDDRLFKIRNCMNISGIRRSLALFQPPIDPMLLVRSKAAGLNLEEILANIETTGGLPNYRFTYMLEKAKQFAQTVQGFGSALLAALEKKDGEELMLLRGLHERNILRLTKDIKNKQVQDAQKQYNASEESLINIENRIANYKRLIDEGLSGWELTQQKSKHTATITQSASTLFYGQSSVLALLPQLGSPFSLNWGGEQQREHFKNWGMFLNDIASVAESISSSAGLEATFQRRKQEWDFQLLTAKQDLKQSTEQLLAADLRIRITERDLEIHEKTIEQSNEVDEFFRIKMTNFGLYNYMATTLNRLYRASYRMALEMAKQAEACYAHELYDDTQFIGSDNWDNNNAGLLAGESLMLQLNRMEAAYLKGYQRCPEITQNFSLSLIDSKELLTLRQTGKCIIKLPEIAFDILYPGHYRRLIKGVRISIPCIAGPYTNVSANLKLTKSELRINETDELTLNIVAKDATITTSSAANDSGSFEFNFRDERYLPFEYAGAISEWELNLPSRIRSFNYNSISDVIIHLSYVAQEGNRENGENKIIEAFKAYSESTGLVKVISLKYEFADQLHKLLNSMDESIEFNITSEFFPYFLMDKDLSIMEVKVYLKPKKGIEITAPGAMNFNEGISVLWDPTLDIPQSTAAEENKLKGGIVSLTGSPVKIWKIDVGSDGIDKEKIEDILIFVKYRF